MVQIVIVYSVISLVSFFNTRHCRPQKYGMYQFDEKLVDNVTDWLRKAIVLSTWMASMAREQLYQFREFKIWLRYGNYFSLYFPY